VKLPTWLLGSCKIMLSSAACKITVWENRKLFSIFRDALISKFDCEGVLLVFAGVVMIAHERIDSLLFCHRSQMSAMLPHANLKVTLDSCVQAVSNEKRNAQSKVVESFRAQGSALG
jgi:hypothetical protein